jgi:RNA polymerase sigma-70 factor (ECF subfamily)
MASSSFVRRDSSGPSGGSSISGRDEEADLDMLRIRLGNGDAAAFERIFRCLSESVFRFVCGMVQDEALADDLTQDTFARLWAARDRMEEVDSLRAYVFQMARNRVYNQQRNERVRRDNRARFGEARTNNSTRSPDATLDTDLLRSMFEEWIEELPDRQREALILRRRSHLSHDEIADVMDISPSTVNNHLVRAMRHLRDRLDEHRPDLLS